MVNDTDRALVERVLGGDKAIFGLLIDRHRAAVLRFARRMVGAADAEDIVQEALLSALLSLGKLRDHDGFRAWLMGIVANLGRTRLRTKHEGYVPDWFGGRLLPEFRLEEAEPSAELIYETKELHLLVCGEIDKLPTEQRDAVLGERITRPLSDKLPQPGSFRVLGPYSNFSQGCCRHPK